MDGGVDAREVRLPIVVLDTILSYGIYAMILAMTIATLSCSSVDSTVRYDTYSIESIFNVMSCHVISHPIISYHIISYRILIMCV
jgi:hypothetical protein